MNQLTQKVLTEKPPVLREVSATECEAITGGYDDVVFCATPWSKVPPIPQVNYYSQVVNAGAVMIR